MRVLLSIALLLLAVIAGLLAIQTFRHPSEQATRRIAESLPDHSPEARVLASRIEQHLENAERIKAAAGSVCEGSGSYAYDFASIGKETKADIEEMRTKPFSGVVSIRLLVESDTGQGMLLSPMQVCYGQHDHVPKPRDRQGFNSFVKALETAIADLGNDHGDAVALTVKRISELEGRSTSVAFPK